jgi:hypothetical protein
MPPTGPAAKGTGFAVSLTYSSTPSSGPSNESRPFPRRWSDVAFSPSGGQRSKRRHSFRPVSKTVASASDACAVVFSATWKKWLSSSR